MGRPDTAISEQRVYVPACNGLCNPLSCRLGVKAAYNQKEKHKKRAKALTQNRRLEVKND